ncbi:hypothetical protein Tco_1126814, partial [Tanacetum coccineum]
MEIAYKWEARQGSICTPARSIVLSKSTHPTICISPLQQASQEVHSEPCAESGSGTEKNVEGSVDKKSDKEDE